MKIIAPSYYNSFKCIADKCRHSCCIGWEIDIDEKTAEKYKNITGEFGRRLKKAVSFEDGVYSFKLTKDERCPFLNCDGLCDIFIELGEENLCSICTDHPRFRNYFSSHIEIGLGLCCEEAARIIVENEDDIQLAVIADDGNNCTPTEDEEELLSIRHDIFCVLNSDIEFNECERKILEYIGAVYPEKTIHEWTDILLSLERLDGEWTLLLQELKRKADLISLEASVIKTFDREFKNLLAYFIYRHLADSCDWQELCARVCFSLFGCKVIDLLCLLRVKNGKELSVSYIEEVSRLYSSEIEYSKENTDTLLDVFLEANTNT